LTEFCVSEIFIGNTEYTQNSYVNEGKLNIVPKNIFKLEETYLALENFLSRKNIGKSVIKL